MSQIKELKPETVIALDGKTIRASARKRRNLKGLHIVNSWSCANGISLGQIKVSDKSNEITAVPELLKQLAIEGAIVTMDAMGCQKKTIKQISQANAEYVVALKGNQGELHETVKDSFALADSGIKSLTIQHAIDQMCAEHGRIDQRQIEVIDAKKLEGFIDSSWEALNSLIRITSEREEAGKQYCDQRYYISSLPSDNPKAIMHAIRSHWQIENCLHWSLMRIKT